ncbi:MAG: hypothetical protein H7641_08780 [Candidatus Heimdallarchaeota archaeon]|nr:hypothetical protein [Candidatus Heimdallarchaeota archaeon]MCK4877660.1 hypothetical protein [Candidatus Heimdallarchaeota archaeon]
MKKKQTIFFVFLASILLIQMNNSLADNENIELLSKGSGNVEGYIEYTTMDTDTHAITYSKKFNLTYRIDDVWVFDDIKEKVVQITQKRYQIEYNGVPDLSETITQTSRLIWQKNASWLFSNAEQIYTRTDGTWSFKISLCHIRTYSDIIDPYNAQVTFHNGTIAIVRDIYETMESSYERLIIYGYVNGGFHYPSHIPSYYYILSPNAELNQEMRFLGNVTDFVEINIGDELFQTIRVEKNVSEFFSETNFYISHHTYYFEKETGLLVKYKKNYTDAYDIDLEEFKPQILEIPYKTSRIVHSTISIIFVLVVTTLIRRRDKNSRY